MLIGYARVSTTGQNLESQIERLQSEGCDTIFQEKLETTAKCGAAVISNPETVKSDFQLPRTLQCSPTWTRPRTISE